MTTGKILRSGAAIIIGLGLIVGLLHFTGVTLQSIGATIAQLNWLAFGGMLICTYLFVILGGVKWHLISATPPPRPFFYTHYTAQALMLGQILPAPIAVAINRTAVMKFKQKATLKKGLLNALYDMGFDFLIALLMIPISLLQWYYHFAWSVWLAGCLGIIVIAGFCLREAPHIVPEAWLKKLGLHDERKSGMLSRHLIGLMMVLSTARFALAIFRLILGAWALNVAVPAATVAYATPLVTMSALLMFTPANIGIAEWSWAYVLTLWAVPMAVGSMYGVSFRILVIAAQFIIGGVCWALYTVADSRR